MSDTSGAWSRLRQDPVMAQGDIGDTYKLQTIGNGGEATLREPCVPIHPNHEELFEATVMAKVMTDAMIKWNGVGLAGPQVGYNKQIIVVLSNKVLHVFLNPRVEPLNKDITVNEEERCLSLPGEKYRVTRPRAIKLTALRLNGDRIELFASGLFARIIQHEVDHLNGVLICDKEVKP